MTTTDQSKAEALAKFLGEDIDNITESTYDDSTFKAGNAEYMVLTDSEADEKAAEYIKESLWAFNASFLSSYCDLPEEVFTALQQQCEGANEAILRCIERADGGLAGFIEEAISADGRGHFLSSYDGNENEEGDYFIYRTN